MPNSGYASRYETSGIVLSSNIFQWGNNEYLSEEKNGKTLEKAWDF